jgi:outer membrane protein assembly factor BamB
VRCFPLIVALVACGKSEPAPPTAKPPTGSAPAAPAPAPSAKAVVEMATECEKLSFAESTPVPEASGAGWLEIDGALALVVVSDSGNDGAYGVVDPTTGVTREEGKLPLGSAGADTEGLAAKDGLLYGVTSSGWIRVWKRAGKGFELAQDAYALGPVDLPDKKSKLSAPDGKGMVCGAKAGNCGRDYEGLCLANKPPTGDNACVGFVASRADGHVYCLEQHDGKLRVIHGKSVKIGKSGTLADCAFSDDDRLLVGANLFGTDQVVVVEGWGDPATAKVVPLAPIGVGFPEVIAARGDIVYRMSDTGGAPSLMARYRCPK